MTLCSADNAQPLGLCLLCGGHDEAVALGVDSDRLLKEGVDTLLGSILEMSRTEHRRSCDDDHVDTGVDDLLVGIETDEAILVSDYLVALLLKFVLKANETVFEGVSKGGDGDPVSCIKEVHYST